jgi:hypothetical protein
MINIAEVRATTLPPAQEVWGESQVSQALGRAQYRLSDGRLATQAASTLLTPRTGDTVALFHSVSGLFITHVLLRAPDLPDAANAGHADLAVPGAQVLAIKQAGFEVSCTQKIALRCLGDVELTSAAGAVSVNAKNFLSTVSESMVQTAQHLVTQVEHCMVQASSMLRMHGRQALLTAEDDLKIDAERVSLG